MTMQITIDVPNRLGQQLQQFKDGLPEVLERGVRELLFECAYSFQDEKSIMLLLASQPTPEQVLAIRPSHDCKLELANC